MTPLDVDREPRTGLPNDRLWAVASYFNPAGYHNRLTNYRRFARSLSIPLVTVELSFGSPFELHQDDATTLVQIRARDVLWQKERLLNIALSFLPAHCDAVAHLDTDVVFERDDWAQRSLAMLEGVPLVQPFTDFCDLPAGRGPSSFRRGRDAFTGRSLASMVNEGGTPRALLETCGSRFRRTPCAGGFAWVARRTLVEQHRFYDTCVIGSGNHAMVAAAYGVPELSVRSLHMNQARTRHYRSWADPYGRDVSGRVGHLEGAAYHLWHGHLEDRHYRERHVGLSAFDFDPDRDLRLDDNECWEWGSDKPEMHAFVRRYFDSRREDGRRSD